MSHSLPAVDRASRTPAPGGGPARSLAAGRLANLAHVLAGSGAYLALGFVSHLIVANSLPAEALGSLALALAAMTILQEVCGTGVDEALVRYAAPYAASDHLRADSVFRAALRIKLTANIVVALVAWGLAGTVSQWLGRGLEMTAPIRWAAVGGFGASLLGLSLGVLQARQRFLQYAILRPLANLLKVAVLAAFWFTGTLTLSTAIGTSALVSFAALALLPWLTSVGFVFSRPTAGFAPGRAIVVFSAWLVAAKVLFALYARVDLLLIEYFGTPADVASYWVASSLLFLLDLTTFSVIVSLLPEASQIHDRASLRRYVGSAIRQCGALAVLFLPALLFIGPIVELLYGGRYPDTPGLFRILFWGSFATLVVHPLYLVLYARSKPPLVALINLVQAVACAAGCWFLIPLWGVTGAAVASMLARLAGCLLILATVTREMRMVTAAARSEELRQVV